MAETLRNYSIVMFIILLIFGGIFASSINTSYPVIVAFIVSIANCFFCFSIAEIIDKLQNIENNTKK